MLTYMGITSESTFFWIQGRRGTKREKREKKEKITVNPERFERSTFWKLTIEDITPTVAGIRRATVAPWVLSVLASGIVALFKSSPSPLYPR